MFTTEGVTCSATAINRFSGGAVSCSPDPAGDEVRLAGKDVAIAFGAGDAARAFQSGQHLLQLLLARGHPAQVPEQFRDVGRHIATLAE